MRTLIILLVFAVSGFAENYWKTDGLINGRFWLSGSVAEKLAYITGFYDGYENSTVTSRTCETSKKSTKAPPSFQPKEVSDLMDTFYKDSLNLNIPMRDMIAYVLFYLRGEETKEVFESKLILIRQTWANARVE